VKSGIRPDATYKKKAGLSGRQDIWCIPSYTVVVKFKSTHFVYIARPLGLEELLWNTMPGSNSMFLATTGYGYTVPTGCALPVPVLFVLRRAKGWKRFVGKTCVHQVLPVLVSETYKKKYNYRNCILPVLFLFTSRYCTTVLKGVNSVNKFCRTYMSQLKICYKLCIVELLMFSHLVVGFKCWAIFSSCFGLNNIKRAKWPRDVSLFNKSFLSFQIFQFLVAWVWYFCFKMYFLGVGW
jgi:hypothetical protein